MKEKQKHIIKRTFAILIAVMMLVIATACGGSGSSGDISGSSDEEFTVGVICWPTSMIPYVSEEMNYFKEEGLNVKIKMFQQSTDAYSAMVSGKLDMCLMGSQDAAVRYAQGATNLKIVDQTEFSNGADGLVARKGINSVKDLKGKKIATEYFSDDHYYLMLLLDEAGLTLDDVEIVNMSIQNSGSAFIAGKVDAASIWEPTLTETLNSQKGKCNLIASTKDNPKMITGAWVASTDAIENRGEDVLKFMRGIHKGLYFYRQNEKKAVKIMTKHLGWNAAEKDNGLLFTNLEDTKKLFTPAEDISYTGYKVQKNCEFLKELGQIDSVPDQDEVIDSRFIDELLKEKEDGAKIE